MVAVLTASVPGRHAELARAVASVTRQTIRPVEHLIRVDHDGAGSAETRNVLLRATRQEWVAILDDDDELLPDHLEILLGAAGDDVDVVYTDPHPDGFVPPGVGGDFSSDRLRARNMIPATVLLRREAALDVGGFPPVYAEDWGLWLVLDHVGARFRHVDAATWIYHRGHAGKSTTRPAGARAEALGLVGL